MKNWKTIYHCECGNVITNGVGKWDDIFFLTEVCPSCGCSKYEFKKIGVAYSRWTPTILNWFKFTWIYKDNK